MNNNNIINNMECWKHLNGLVPMKRKYKSNLIYDIMQYFIQYLFDFFRQALLQGPR
jgi:hypothetical protein